MDRSARLLRQSGVGLGLCLVLLFATPALAAEPQFPALSGRVVDEANILSPGTRTRLTELLAEHEQKSGQQIVVVTVKSLQGLPIEDFGYQLGRHWGIGEKDKNTGALLIAAPAERRVRIEVGYGLEGQLTDAQSRVIIEQTILPAFRRGDFNGGMLDGTTAILRLLGGDAASGTGTAPRPLAQGGRDSATVIDGLLIAAIWIFICWVMWRRRGAHALPFLFVGGGGYHGGGFGGGGGGFSGGGGSFGGGGASGSW